MNTSTDEVLRLYGQYTALEVREDASPAPDVIHMARKKIGEAITGILAEDSVGQQFVANIEAAQAFEDDMTMVEDLGVLSEDEMLAARKNVPRDVQMGLVALKFLMGESDAEAKKVDHPLPQLFNGPVADVAERVKGKRLIFGDSEVLVAETTAQTAEDNTRWLASRPLFGEKPVDVYVAGYRGNPMLFFRASEKDSCVRIVSGIYQADGSPLKNSKQVCEALGLTGETVGHLEVEDNRITIIIDGEREKA